MIYFKLWFKYILNLGMKKKQQNLPVKAKQNEVITVNQEKTKTLDITNKLHHFKNRSEVRGGGKKPYRQKGTGRARAGTIRSPLWRGGGVTFASRPRDFSKKINKKMYRAAIKSIFSELVRQNRLVAIEKPTLKKPKTKEVANFLNEFSLSKVLIITDELDMNLYLSARNIPNVDVITVREINPINLLKPQKVAVTGEALKQIEEWING